MIWVFLLACPPKVPPAPAKASLILGQETDLVEDRQPVAPGPWVEPTGDDARRLHLIVPRGWSGTAGRVGAPLVLRLTHAETGSVVEIWQYASGDWRPRERRECSWLFVDGGSYRRVPLLPKAKSASCASELPLGPLVQGYYGDSGRRALHIEVTTPHQGHFRSRRAVEPLLLGLSAR